MTTVVSITASTLNSFIRLQTEQRAEQAEQQAKALESQASAKRREATQANKEAKRFDSEARQADNQASALKTNLTSAERLEQNAEQNRDNLSDAIKSQSINSVEQNNDAIKLSDNLSLNMLFNDSLQQNILSVQPSASRLGQQINLYI